VWKTYSDEVIRNLGFDLKRQKIARNYGRQKLIVKVLEMVFLAIVVIAVMVTGASEWFRTWAAGISSNDWIVVLIYSTVALVVFFLSMLPFDLYSEFRIEKRFGLSKYTIGRWIKDFIVSMVVNTILFLLLLEVCYFLLRVTELWWLLMWAFFTLFILFILFISPVVINPLFNKYDPLEDEELSGRLSRLADKADIKVKGSFVQKAGEKTTKAGAYITGIGATKRIVLYDTLIERYTPDEIESVIAHELGHDKLLHIPKIVVMMSLTTLLILFITDQFMSLVIDYTNFASISDVALLPVIAFSLGTLVFLTQPIRNTHSRYCEKQADHYAFELANRAEAEMNVLVKLSNDNLSRVDPHPIVEFFFHDHPALVRRVEYTLAHLDRTKKAGGNS